MSAKKKQLNLLQVYQEMNRLSNQTESYERYMHSLHSLQNKMLTEIGLNFEQLANILDPNREDLIPVEAFKKFLQGKQLGMSVHQVQRTMLVFNPCYLDNIAR